MSNEEQTQVFRGDDAPPELAIAETGGPPKARKTDGPVDERSVRDQEHGPTSRREMRDGDDEHADLRQLHDAKGEALDARHLRDADATAEGLAHGRGDGPSDPRHLTDADGLSDQRRMEDADGLSDQRRMEDAEGLSDQRRMEDAEGLSDRRELRDHRAEIPPGAGDAEVTLNRFGDVVEGEQNIEDETSEDGAVEEAPMSDPDLSFKVDEDATPWALSIHLEERIANLSESTLKVNEQLDGLEESIKRLAKRIGK